MKEKIEKSLTTLSPDPPYGGQVSFSVRNEKYKFSKYFENEVLRKRPYIKKEWCIKVIENPIKVEKQEGNR